MKKMLSMLAMIGFVSLFLWLAVLSAPDDMIDAKNPTLKATRATATENATPEPPATELPRPTDTQEKPTEKPPTNTKLVPTDTPNKPPTSTWEPPPTYTPVPSQTPGGATATPEDTPPTPPTSTQVIVILRTPGDGDKPDRETDQGPAPTSQFATANLPSTGYGPPDNNVAKLAIISLVIVVSALVLITLTSRKYL